MYIKKSEDFGNIVRRERKALGMTQQELAAALGYSADDSGHCIYMIEKGKRGLSSEKVERLKEIFQCSDDYLLGKTERNSKIFLGVANLGENLSSYMSLASTCGQIYNSFIAAGFTSFQAMDLLKCIITLSIERVDCKGSY